MCLVVQSVVHCLHIGDALRLDLRKRGEQIPEDLTYPWPGPETIGLTLAPDQAARVQALAPGSAAASAGLMPGDDVHSLEGQPLLSSADFSWVLHRAQGGAGSLNAVVNRNGQSRTLTLTLPDRWKTKADISRRHLGFSWNCARRLATRRSLRCGSGRKRAEVNGLGAVRQTCRRIR